MCMRLARGAATSGLRTIDGRDPLSWQFSGFSQNGEDGIISELLAHLRPRKRTFVEIGCGNGLENNTGWLAFAMKYTGVMIEADTAAVQFCRDHLQRHNWGVTFMPMFVTLDEVDGILELAGNESPDVLSIDIDGNDFHILRALLETGLRPGILVVEFNSAFGPDSAVTIPYGREFRRGLGPDALYYGASIGAWRTLLPQYQYEFVTVESNGVNAFFAHRPAFEGGFLDGLNGLEFAENFAERRMRGPGWRTWGTSRFESQLLHL